MKPISPLVERWLQEAKENPEDFWERAAEQLPWLKKWDRVFEWTPPTFRWFIGGQTNLAYSALDHQVERGRGSHTALVYLNERGERRVFTYAQLLHEVERICRRAARYGHRQRRPHRRSTCRPAPRRSC